MVLYVLNSSLWLRKPLTCTVPRELERAVQIDPKSSAAYYKLAELYRKAGERERAQNALEWFSGTQGKRASGQWLGSYPGLLGAHKTAGFRAG